jgi:cytoskeletal protein RodZ
MKWIALLVCLASCLSAAVENQIQYQQTVENAYKKNAVVRTETQVSKYTRTFTATPDTKMTVTATPSRTPTPTNTNTPTE